MSSRHDPLGMGSSPIAIIAQAPAQSTIATLVAAKKEAGSPIKRHEFLHHLTHEVSNTKHDDGRINLGTDEQGRVLANSVSPYSQIFWDNVEDGVRPLIEALRSKRYLPYSSCEGHCTTSRRYIGLAFANEETRSVFAQSIEKLRLTGVICKKLDRVANMKHSGDAEDVENPLRSDSFLYYQRDDETDGFNVSFHRNYERYWFLELIIFDVSPPASSLQNLWKSIKLRTLKKFFWESTTRKIEMAVRSNEFPIYPA